MSVLTPRGVVGTLDRSAKNPWDTYIRPKLPEIVQTMRVSLLLDHLIARRLVSDYERQKLAVLTTEIEKCRYLLFDVLPYNLPWWETFEKFCECIAEVPQQSFILTDIIQPAGLDLNYDNQSVDENIYQQAIASDSVPINRYRVMVVGQDGAGKSCLIDSFLDRQFKPRNPSTDGIAIHVAVTAAEGKAGQRTWHKEEYKKAHLDKYLAAGYVITKKQRQETVSSTTRRVSRETQSVRRVTAYKTPLAKRKKLHHWRSPDEPQSDEDATELDQHIEKITRDEGLTSEQQKIITEYLQSSEALASLENFEVSSKLLWDLGGQERYLTSHSALMPTESEYTVCMYLLVIDISKPLGDKAESSYRLGGTSADVPLELSSILYNRDFPRHWFTSIGISHPSDMSPPYMGENLSGVSYPAVLIAATHIDKAAKMPDSEEFLKRQNAELDELIRDLRCEDHIVKNGKNGQWFFRVDNTKSGLADESERCEGVKTISSLLDNSSKHYWSKKNKTRPIPVAWVRFELILVSWKMGKIISIKTATKLAYRVGIKSEEESLLAIKFLHNLGVIFYFWDVSDLANIVIVDPTWLINTVAAFVTTKEPPKVMYKRRWRKLCETGKFSRDMVVSMLTEAKVESRDQEPVLDVLRMLDIICDPSKASSSTFFIPCMLSRKLTGPSKWENYSLSEAFPPPIVIYPDEVQTIPEALFFRIVTKCTREYPKECELTRNRCLFRVGYNLVLELLHYNDEKRAGLVVSMTGEGNVKRASMSVVHMAPVVRQFILDSVESAKKRGMNGLKVEFYYQVAECIRSTTSDKSAGKCQPPDCLIKFPDNGPDDQSVFRLSGEYCTEEELERVRLWYNTENLSESQNPHNEETLSRKPTTEELIDLSKALVSTWKVIALRLKIPDTTIERIESDYEKSQEKAYKVLQAWIEQESEAASVEALCRALCKEDMRATAATIFRLDDEVLCGFSSN